MPEIFTEKLANNLNKFCAHDVMELNSETKVKNNCIYIAKGGVHMELIRKGGVLFATTSTTAPENNCRPSVDVLFRSFAEEYRKKGLAIILTGMGKDGANSLKKLKEVGATVFVQDEASSVVWGMPGAAVNTGYVDKIISLDLIPDEITQLISR